MKAKLAFYKGDGDIVDKLIKFGTRSNYSHVELVMDTTWYSTSPRLLRVKSRHITPKKTSWDYVEVEVDQDAVNEFYSETEGKKYDWLAIVFSHILPFNIHWKDRWICSEWCAKALGFKNCQSYSPQTLYEKVTKKN